MKNMFINFMCCLYHKVYFVIYSILFALGFYPVPMSRGMMVVSGQDHAEIKLSETPKYVKVYFNDQCVVVPCDPQKPDFVSSNLDLCCLTLNICWDVSGVREIIWELY